MEVHIPFSMDKVLLSFLSLSFLISYVFYSIYFRIGFQIFDAYETGRALPYSINLLNREKNCARNGGRLAGGCVHLCHLNCCRYLVLSFFKPLVRVNYIPFLYDESI